MLSTHLFLVLSSDLLPSGLPTKIMYAPLPSPITAACPVHLSLLYCITHMFKERKDWVNLQLTFFFSSTLSSVYYISMRFVVLTAAFLRIQFVCVDTVSLCEWFRCFERGYYGPSKRREPLTKLHSLLSQKIRFLILELVYT
jgi:hypothetical protein